MAQRNVRLVGEVISVNVAMPRTLRRRGRDVPTGLWKRPVAGAVAVGELGLEGDLQADRRVHGGAEKAVYAYAAEDVAWWEEQLGRELGPGFFGENLTLEGVDVSGARRGERWQIGSVALEVTEPRHPCWKLAAKVGEPGFIKLFTEAGRPGTYLRVLTEGEIVAGDEVRRRRTAGLALLSAHEEQHERHEPECEQHRVDDGATRDGDDQEDDSDDEQHS